MDEEEKFFLNSWPLAPCGPREGAKPINIIAVFKISSSLPLDTKQSNFCMIVIEIEFCTKIVKFMAQRCWC